MGLSCFVIVAAIAASLPAGSAPRAGAARAPVPSMTSRTMVSANDRAGVELTARLESTTRLESTALRIRARETIEPPPMAHGRRSAHRSVRRLVAAE
jgi:hypothetical protein